MKLKKCSLLTVTISLLLLFTALSVSAEKTAVDSGFCGIDGDNLTWVLYDDGELVISGKGEMADAYSADYGKSFNENDTIKAVTIEDGVTSVGAEAFKLCRNLEEVSLPETVSSIGRGAFSYTALTNVILPDKITVLEDYTFRDCDKLEYVELSENIITIGSCVFERCDSLGKIILPDGLETIETKAFSNCPITDLVIPDSVTAIYGGAFDTRYLENVVVGSGIKSINGLVGKNIRSIVIGENVTEILSSQFENCKGLKEIVIPSKVKKIGEAAFRYCSSLEKVTINEGVKTISNSVFAFCTSLKEVILPDSVTSIGYGIFSICTSLEKVILPSELKELRGSTFNRCIALKEIKIPDTVNSIGGDEFYGCESLEEIVIPDGVLKIENLTFGNCTGLKKITIPATVYSMYSKAFEGTENIEEVFFSGTEKLWKSNHFDNISQLWNAKKHFHISEEPSRVVKATLTKNGKYIYDCTCGEAHNTAELNRPYYFYPSSTYYYYNGKNKTPKVTVKDTSNNLLKEGTDFDVVYPSNRKAIGEHTYKIVFKGNYSGTKKLTFEIRLNKPGIKSKVVTADSCKITWEKVKGATGYRVYKRNEKTGKFEKVKDTTSNTYTFTKLKGATQYSYAIKAYAKVDGKTVWAKAYSSGAFVTKPEAFDVTVKTSGKNVTLSWNKLTGKMLTGYCVYMKKDDGEFTKIATTKKTSYKIKDLKKGTYQFRVRGYVNMGSDTLYGEFKTYTIKIK
ncbi:MAG: leucine-rich repeat protein [Clostridia bacterium]|nr:leucine-rich repeat protein [Clostridia bacterium]